MKNSKITLFVVFALLFLAGCGDSDYIQAPVTHAEDQRDNTDQVQAILSFKEIEERLKEVERKIFQNLDRQKIKTEIAELAEYFNQEQGLQKFLKFISDKEQKRVDQNISSARNILDYLNFQDIQREVAVSKLLLSIRVMKDHLDEREFSLLMKHPKFIDYATKTVDVVTNEIIFRKDIIENYFSIFSLLENKLSWNSLDIILSGFTRKHIRGELESREAKDFYLNFVKYWNQKHLELEELLTSAQVSTVTKLLKSTEINRATHKDLVEFMFIPQVNFDSWEVNTSTEGFIKLFDVALITLTSKLNNLSDDTLIEQLLKKQTLNIENGQNPEILLDQIEELENEGRFDKYRVGVLKSLVARLKVNSGTSESLENYKKIVLETLNSRQEKDYTYDEVFKLGHTRPDLLFRNRFDLDDYDEVIDLRGDDNKIIGAGVYASGRNLEIEFNDQVVFHPLALIYAPGRDVQLSGGQIILPSVVTGKNTTQEELLIKQQRRSQEVKDKYLSLEVPYQNRFTQSDQTRAHRSDIHKVCSNQREIGKILSTHQIGRRFKSELRPNHYKQMSRTVYEISGDLDIFTPDFSIDGKTGESAGSVYIEADSAEGVFVWAKGEDGHHGSHGVSVREGLANIQGLKEGSEYHCEYVHFWGDPWEGNDGQQDFSHTIDHTEEQNFTPRPVLPGKSGKGGAGGKVEINAKSLSQSALVSADGRDGKDGEER